MAAATGTFTDAALGAVNTVKSAVGAGAEMKPVGSVYTLAWHYSGYIFTLALGTIWMLFVFSCCFYTYIGKPIAKRAINDIRMVEDKVESQVGGCLEGKNGSSFAARHSRFRPVFTAIVHVFAIWPFRLLMAIVRLFLNSVFRSPTLIVIGILMYAFLSIEANKTTSFVFADGAITAGRVSGNIAFSVANLVFDISDAIFLPIWNSTVLFVVNMLRVTVKHLGPYFVSGAENIGTIGGSNGRRLVFTALDNNPNFETLGFRDGVAGLDWFPVLFDAVKKAMVFIMDIVDIISTLIVIVWDLFLTVILVIPKWYVLVLQIVKAPVCFVQFPLCGFRQLAQFVIDSALDLVNFAIDLLVSLFTFGTASGIGHIPTGTLLVACSEVHTVDDCKQCGDYFTRWTCTQTRRVLSCDSPDDVHWSEQLHISDEVRPLYRSAAKPSPQEGCPLTHRGLGSKIGHLENMVDFGKFECYHIAVNNTLVLEGCPPANATTSPHVFTVEDSGRRSLASQKSATDYLRTLFSHSVKINMAKGARRSNNEEEEVIPQEKRVTYEKHEKLSTHALKDMKGKSVYDCDDVREGATPAEYVFNTHCHVQAMSRHGWGRAQRHLMGYVDDSTTAAKKFYDDTSNRRRRMDVIIDTTHLHRSFLNVVNVMNDKLQFAHHLLSSDMPVRRRMTTVNEDNPIDRAQRRILATTTLGGNARCPRGSHICPDDRTCTDNCDCVIPPDVSKMPFAFQMRVWSYNVGCQTSKFSFKAYVEDTLDCWNSKDAQSATGNNANEVRKEAETQKQGNVFNDDLIGFGNEIGDAFTGKKKVCFPQYEQFPYRLPVISYDLQETVRSQCGDAQTVSECYCPGYVDDVFEFDGWWIKGVSLHVYYRLQNGARVFWTMFSGLIWYLTAGGFSEVWKAFWSAWPLMNTTTFPTLFEVQWTSNLVGCTMMHLGSLFFCWFYVYLYWIVLISVFEECMLIFLDIADGAVWLLEFAAGEKASDTAAGYRKAISLVPTDPTDAMTRMKNGVSNGFTDRMSKYVGFRPKKQPTTTPTPIKRN